VWGQLERESETVELLFGMGVLSHQNLLHPLVVQKLNMEFDAEVGEFVFRETDREPDLYAPLFEACGFGFEVVQEGRQLLGNTEVRDPLGAVLQRLWPELTPVATIAQFAGDQLQVAREPMLFLGSRSMGFASAAESFLGALPRMQELPASLVRIVGFDLDEKGEIFETMAPVNRPDPAGGDPLYTMPANPEQARVAGRLAAHGTVLVQGPPGTGKTHTIANLIPHLLAQGKSVLVTSHRTKALRVLRDMVNPKVRPLCVSVLENEGESRDQLEEAVKGMVGLFSSSDPEDLSRLAETFRERRTEIKQRLATLEQKLIEARTAEYVKIPTVDGEPIHPSRAAQEIAAGRGVHDWIPGPVTLDEPLPLKPDEVVELYALNSLITPADEQDLTGRLVPLDDVPSERRFAQDLGRRRARREAAKKFESALWTGSDDDLEGLQRLNDLVEACLQPLAEADVLQLEVIRSGLAGGEAAQAWKDLAEFVDLTKAEIAALERQVMAVGPTLDSDLPLATQESVCLEIIAHLRAGKSIDQFTLFTKAQWKKLLSGIRIANSAPKTAEDMEAVKALIDVHRKRETLRNRWDRQVGRWLDSNPRAAAQIPGGGALGERPEETCSQHIGRLLKCLSWADSWAECRQAMQDVGLRWEIVEERVPPNPAPQGDILRLRTTLSNHMRPVLDARMAFVEVGMVEKAKARLLCETLDVPEQEDPGGLIARLRDAVQAEDIRAYGEAWNRLVVLHQQKAHSVRRDSYLNRVK
ncbi:MAG: AAA family ATPase, partial [Candidatus Eremiobacterota bacterium]